MARRARLPPEVCKLAAPARPATSLRITLLAEDGVPVHKIQAADKAECLDCKLMVSIGEVGTHSLAHCYLNHVHGLFDNLRKSMHNLKESDVIGRCRTILESL